MPKRILLADDSITIQKVIGLTFANEDVLLTVVDNGDEAVIKAKELVPDLIIADVVMPGKDGYEVCYSTKQDPNLQHIPVLLLTGTFEQFDEAMAKKVGADGSITKPFESQALIDKVNELIGRATSKPGPSMDALNDPTPIAAFDDLQPVEMLDEIAPLEPMEMEELQPMQPMETSPLEEFNSAAPDTGETSFADMSLEETVEQTPEVDLGLATPMDMPMEMAPEPVPTLAAAEPVQADGEPNWNVSEFNDYMAASAGAAPVAAPAPAPAPSDDFSDLDPVDDVMVMDAVAEPAPLMEIAPEPVEELIQTSDASGFDDLPAETDSFVDTVSDQESISEPAAMFGELTPEPEMVSDAGAAQIDEIPVQADAFDSANLSGTDDPLTEAFAVEPAAEPSREPYMPPPPVEIADVDSAMELTAVGADLHMPLAKVADMYPLDEPAAAAPEQAYEAEAPAFTPAAAPVAPSYAAAPLSGELQAQMQNVPQMVEDRVRAMLSSDTLLQSLGEKTARLVETQVEEALRKVAPEIIEQMVRKALADATERILNETIGRLRKD